MTSAPKRKRRPIAPRGVIDYPYDPPPSSNAFGVACLFREYADTKHGEWTKVVVLVPKRAAGQVKRALVDRRRGDHAAEIYLLIERMQQGSEPDAS